MEYGKLIGRERVIVVFEQCEDGRTICIFEVEDCEGGTLTVICKEGIEKCTCTPVGENNGG